MSDEYQYALWFWSETGHMQTVQIYDTEYEAARAALAVLEHTDGSVDGLQRSDGALMRVSEWPLLQALREEARRKEAENPPVQVPPHRKVENPFVPVHRSYGAMKAWVPEDFPAWVGRQKGGE